MTIFDVPSAENPDGGSLAIAGAQTFDVPHPCAYESRVSGYDPATGGIDILAGEGNRICQFRPDLHFYEPPRKWGSTEDGFNIIGGEILPGDRVYLIRDIGPTVADVHPVAP